MSFFTPKPVFDFLTGTDEKNCMPWKARSEGHLTRHSWSEPYPEVFNAESALQLEAEVREYCRSERFLVLGISPATCAIGPKGIEVWTLTLILQEQVT
jgi:hypothetical protein